MAQNNPPVMPGYDIDYTKVERRDVKPPQKPKKEKTGRKFWRDYLETIIIAFLAALVLRLFVVSAYHVASGSMEDTLYPGDYIFVSKLAYEYGFPKIGDVVVFENPYDSDRDYIKRIVAVEGQTVEIWDKVLYLDGQVAQIPDGVKFVDPEIQQGALSTRDNFGPLVVPEGYYFVMGDNRDDSQDSRFWGCVDKSYIKGKAIFVYFSYEPDPNAPEWKAPYVIETFEVLWHNLTTFASRLRLGRIGQSL